MNDSIGFSTTQSVGKYLESSFTFQNKFKNIFGTSRKIFFRVKIELSQFNKNNNNK